MSPENFHISLSAEEDMATDINRTQVGGNHYAMAIEPIDYIEANNLSFSEGNVIKYVSRWRAKNGVEDLKKARWYIDRLIEQTENS